MRNDSWLMNSVPKGRFLHVLALSAMLMGCASNSSLEQENAQLKDQVRRLQEENTRLSQEVDVNWKDKFEREVGMTAQIKEQLIKTIAEKEKLEAELRKK